MPVIDVASLLGYELKTREIEVVRNVQPIEQKHVLPFVVQRVQLLVIKVVVPLAGLVQKTKVATTTLEQKVS